MSGGGCPLLPQRRKPDIGTIFRDLGEAFIEQGRLTREQMKVFRRIGECRTAAMGGSLWQCDVCRRWVGVYHSCRDRNCPQCGGQKRYEWAQQRMGELLPIPYFHVVFTLPHFLNPLILRNQKATLTLLFRCASQTLKVFASDPKFLGAEPGFLAVLHTWGRRMNYHPHLHCIVTGGGLSIDGPHWAKPSNNRYLFPVRALSKVFRGKFMTGMDELWANGLNPPPDRDLSTRHLWNAYKRQLAQKKKWVVHCVPPTGSPEQVVKYLSRYIKGIAISNKRLLYYRPPRGRDPGEVRFAYKDFTDNGAEKICTLSAEAFARRYLLHVLPSGFMRVRYYGLLANCKRTKSLALSRKLLGVQSTPEVASATDGLPAAEESVERQPRKCPFCQNELGEGEAVTPATRLYASFFIWLKPRARALLWDSS